MDVPVPRLYGYVFSHLRLFLILFVLVLMSVVGVVGSLFTVCEVRNNCALGSLCALGRPNRSEMAFRTRVLSLSPL